MTIKWKRFKEHGQYRAGIEHLTEYLSQQDKPLCFEVRLNSYDRLVAMPADALTHVFAKLVMDVMPPSIKRNCDKPSSVRSILNRIANTLHGSSLGVHEFVDPNLAYSSAERPSPLIRVITFHPPQAVPTA